MRVKANPRKRRQAAVTKVGKRFTRRYGASANDRIKQVMGKRKASIKRRTRAEKVAKSIGAIPKTAWVSWSGNRW